MHHADAVADRLARRADPDRLAVDADLAGVGLVEAVENRHQRRFSGAILADDAVNDAAFDDEIDVIVGVNRAEALVDADQFDGGRGFLGLSGHAGLSSPGKRFRGHAPSTALRAVPLPHSAFAPWGRTSRRRRLPPLRIGAGEGDRAKPGGGGEPGWLKLRWKTCGPEAGSNRALVVGHVVVQIG